MNLYIWGTGRLAGISIGDWIKLEDVKGFIDNNSAIKKFMGKEVYSPEEMKEKEYDAIIVANLYSKEIKKQCEILNIDLDKVIFLYENYILQDMNEDYEFIAKILGKENSERLQKRDKVIRSVETYGDLCFKNSPFVDKGFLKTDYVRTKIFELVVKEIRKRKVPGAVAELGVFRGDFAQYLNYAFPEKTCYLFDTFEGFNESEAKKEVNEGNCTQGLVEALKQTNIEIVMEKMIYKDKVIVKQGYFPESLKGLEETFAFVSLDVDLEDSIYTGLDYFYPRLSKGGYIFIHDYNGSLFGVEKAIDKYEKENNTVLHKVPLCDIGGTLVVTK